MEGQATTMPSQFTAEEDKKARNRSGQDEIRLDEALIMLVASQFTSRKNQGSGQEQTRLGAGQVRGKTGQFRVKSQ